ncbi:MAG: adenylate/guanylate cyclase domain-containing protein [Desulfobaccales bacterium]
MSIRTYLILSYLALVFLLILGTLMGGLHLVGKLTSSNLSIAEDSIRGVTNANYQLSEEVLTQMGKQIIEAKTKEVATELGYLLQKEKDRNYQELRRDDKIRAVATQKIFTPEGEAGYMIVIDKNAENIFHPDKRVEGQNYEKWQQQYPEMWELVKSSIAHPKTEGYFTFFDKQNQKRKRYTATMQVDGTPFIVVAVVNIDEYFLPTQAKIKNASQEITVQANHFMEKSGDATRRKVEEWGILGGIIFSLFGASLGLGFALAFSRPISQLRDGVQQVGEGNFAVAVPVRGAKEIVHLARAFNNLGHKLTEYIEKRDFIRDTFSRYVTNEVVQKLLESKDALKIGGETLEVTILMSDIRGFTALCAGMDPKQVIIFLNRYLGKMIEILSDNQAVIDEIIGDGILAFFGAPVPLADHPSRAVACALKMQAAMDEINALNAADGLPHLEIGIGINTGAVVVGNIGSERRAKYSVVGAHVNLTSRIESYALGDQVLIGASTYQWVKDQVEVGEVIEAQAKGVPGSITIYEVKGMGEPYNLRLKEKSETLVALPEKFPVQILRISDKIVTGTARAAWILKLCETSAVVAFEGELSQWEDVLLHLLDKQMVPLPGKIYGKVMETKVIGDNHHEGHIHFTSVSPETKEVIQRLTVVNAPHDD